MPDRTPTPDMALKRKEYYISAVRAAPTQADAIDLTFSNLVQTTSQAGFMREPIVNDKPPPKREVFLVLSVIRYDQIYDFSLARVLGFLFEGALCLNNFNLNPEFMTEFKELLKRVQSENQMLKHYGLSVWLFTKGRIEELSDIYGNMAALCSQVEEKGVKISFEILQDEQQLKIFLKQMRYRLRNGDKMAAYEEARLRAG